MLSMGSTGYAYDGAGKHIVFMSSAILNLLGLFIIYLYLCIHLSIDSLYYHAIKYNSSDIQLQAFLRTLIPLFQVFYRRYVNNLTERRKVQRITPSEQTLQFQRILSAILPILLIVATAVGYLLAAIHHEILDVNYPLYLLLMLPMFFFSWRFGHKLKIA